MVVSLGGEKKKRQTMCEPFQDKIMDYLYALKTPLYFSLCFRTGYFAPE